MKKLSVVIFSILQISIYSNFEGPSCSRAMKPWIKKMSSDLVIDDKKGLGFSIRDGEKIQMHFIEQEFPYQIRSYEGNSQKKIEVQESDIQNKDYVFDFRNRTNGRIREKKENESYTHFKLEPTKSVKKSPYLLFFERVFLFNKNKKLTKFEKSTLESCLAALLVSDKKQMISISETINKFDLDTININKISGSYRKEIKQNYKKSVESNSIGN